MLKTSSTESAEPRKSGTGVKGNSRAGRDGSELDRSKIYNVEIDGTRVRDDEVGKKGLKTSKFKNLSKSKKTVESDFFTLGAS